MIVTLTYNCPEEKDALKLALAGMDLSIALSDLKNHLRNILKYSENKSEDYLQAVEDIETKLSDILDQRNLWQYIDL
jgi:hypothetical protein